jgi:hypothetical protein
MKLTEEKIQVVHIETVLNLEAPLGPSLIIGEHPLIIIRQQSRFAILWLFPRIGYIVSLNISCVRRCSRFCVAKTSPQSI